MYGQRVKIAIMTVALREVSYLMGHIADGKAMPKRDSKGEIRIKDLRNETN
jgi:glutamate mutase epsilon subunit